MLQILLKKQRKKITESYKEYSNILDKKFGGKKSNEKKNLLF